MHVSTNEIVYTDAARPSVLRVLKQEFTLEMLNRFACYLVCPNCYIWSFH